MNITITIALASAAVIALLLYLKFRATKRGTVPQQIGNKFGGGIVFYTENNGHKGLIAAENDIDGLYAFYQSAKPQYPVANVGTPDGLYKGKENTNSLTSIDDSHGIAPAAKACANCGINGYNDWYLPSKYELTILCQAKDSVGGFSPGGGAGDQGYYWSSNCGDSGDWNKEYAYVINFTPGQDCAALFIHEDSNCHVRAIRAF